MALGLAADDFKMFRQGRRGSEGSISSMAVERDNMGHFGLGKDLCGRLDSIEQKLQELSGQITIVVRATAMPEHFMSEQFESELDDVQLLQPPSSQSFNGIRATASVPTNKVSSHPHQPLTEEMHVEEFEGADAKGKDNDDAASEKESTQSSNISGMGRQGRDRCQPPADSMMPQGWQSGRRSSVGTVISDSSGESQFSDNRVASVTREQVDVWARGEHRSQRMTVRLSDAIQKQTPLGVFCEWLKMMRLEAQEGRKPRTWRLVHNMTFEVLTSLVILLNAGFVGYSGTANLRTSAFGDPKEEWLDYVEVSFCVFFALELLFRLIAEQPFFFLLGEHRGWNMLDCLICACSTSDILINGLESGSVAIVSIGRLLRLSRFIRIFRLTRVMKHFSALRVIVFAIMNSLGSLFWCFTVIAFINYMFAVLLLFGLADHFHQGSPDTDAILALKDWYGAGVSDIVVALFMAISGGVDWKILFDQWVQLDPMYGWIFMVYIFVMHFGILNVVIATFVRATMESAARDRHNIVEQHVDMMEDYVKKVTQFFKEADVNKTGTLSWEEFSLHMQNSHVKAYFQALELDISQAHKLFELLDGDGDNKISLHEFLNGCMRLRGGASNVDLNMILLHTQRLTSQMTWLRRRNDKQLGILREMWRLSRPGCVVPT